MKKILILLALVSFGASAQNAKVDIIKDPPKAKVDRITDEPKPYIPLIDDPRRDDLLPDRSKNYTADELLYIKAKEPDLDDLLDISFPKATPASPNAGMGVFDSKELDDVFTFNKKISFKITSPEGNFASYFYLNTNDGNSMMDWPAMSKMTNEKMDGEINSFMTANTDFYSYVKSSEGNFSMKMSSGDEIILHDLQTKMASEGFFETFEKTGEVQPKSAGNRFPKVEYRGTADGITAYVWLSDPQDVRLDTRYAYTLTGFYGLGYITSPTGTTYMISGLRAAGYEIAMTNYESVSFRFNGGGFQPIGELVTGALQQNQGEIDAGIRQMYEDAGSEPDPELRALKLKQAAEAEKMARSISNSAADFSQTSDLKDLPYQNLAGDGDFAASYYDTMIAGLESGIKANQKEVDELVKTGYGASSSKVTSLKCSIVCGQTEKARFEKLKADHLAIMEKYKTDPEKRDELVNQLMQKAASEMGHCNC